MRNDMKISDLIKQLEAIKAEHGDLPVKTQTLAHIWEPDVRVKQYRWPSKDSATKYVLLNS